MKTLEHLARRANLQLTKGVSREKAEEMAEAAEADIKKGVRVQTSQAASKRKTGLPREESFLKTVAVLLLAWEGKKLPAGKDLEVIAQRHGIEISDCTLRKCMTEAQERYSKKEQGESA